MWPAESEEETGGDELEGFANQQYLRIGADAFNSYETDVGSDSDASSDESGSEEEVNKAIKSKGMTPASGSQHARNQATSASEFLNECHYTLQRGFADGLPVDDVAIELKALRMVTDVPLRRVREVIIGSLVDNIPLDVDGATQKKEITQIVKRWGALVSKIGGADGVETVSILQV